MSPNDDDDADGDDDGDNDDIDDDNVGRQRETKEATGSNWRQLELTESNERQRSLQKKETWLNLWLILRLSLSLIRFVREATYEKQRKESNEREATYGKQRSGSTVREATYGKHRTGSNVREATYGKQRETHPFWVARNHG